MINELLQSAQTEVDNHSIYVWGGSEQGDIVLVPVEAQND